MTSTASSALRLLRTLLPGLLLVTAASGCGEDATPPDIARDAGMYEVALEELIATSGVELVEGWADPVVFVEVLVEDGIDLETQVAVVEDFAEVYRIRFVDELAEAIELDVAGLPAREGTLLVALGPIEPDGEGYVLHAEYYIAADDAAAFEFHFEDHRPAGSDQPVMRLTDEPVAVATELVVEPL
ncbi:MAG: hypothetical protein R2733_01050 [Acidimicrobiales bacterium]